MKHFRVAWQLTSLLMRSILRIRSQLGSNQTSFWPFHLLDELKYWVSNHFQFVLTFSWLFEHGYTVKRCVLHKKSHLMIPDWTWIQVLSYPDEEKLELYKCGTVITLNPVMVAWLVERLLYKKCHLPTVVQIPLGTHI